MTEGRDGGDWELENAEGSGQRGWKKGRNGGPKRLMEGCSRRGGDQGIGRQKILGGELK